MKMVNISVLKIAKGLGHEVTKSYLVSTDLQQQSSGNFTKSTDNGPYDTMTIVLICIVSGIASLLTVGGNVLVIVSFIINRALRTLSNYLILSLAAADLVIGAISINLFTIYIVKGGWTLGNALCDVWLALDYVASNASVMNLLLICLDRYYSVTSPMKSLYNSRPKKYIFAIIGAWTISVVVWAPWIFFWQYIVRVRTVPQNECYIQFIKDSKVMTVVTALFAFYIPAIVMCCLYYKVYLAIKNRRRTLHDMAAIIVSQQQCSYKSDEISKSKDERRMFSERTTRISTLASGSEQSRTKHYIENTVDWERNHVYQEFKDACAVLRSPISNSKIDILISNTTTWDDNSNDPQHSLQNSTSSEKLDRSDATSKSQQLENYQQFMPHLKKKPTINSRSPRFDQRDHVVNAWIRNSNDEALPSNNKKGYASKRALRLKLQAIKKKLQSLNKETKAARLLASIMAAFILLWLPYNVMVIIEPFCATESGSCIPNVAWNVGYWLCYINSTLNPVCYALCNKTFRRTFVYILTMKWARPGRGRLPQ